MELAAIRQIDGTHITSTVPLALLRFLQKSSAQEVPRRSSISVKLLYKAENKIIMPLEVYGE
jgi:hypothetical protein